MKTIQYSIAVIVVFSLMQIAGQVSEAQVVPFKARGSNSVYYPDTAYTEGTGNGTHLGKFTFSGNAVPFPTNDPLVLNWIALDYAAVAANGDALYMAGGGTVQLIPLGGNLFIAEWSGDFYVTGGSGRFATARSSSSPLKVVAVNDPFVFPPNPGDIWSYDWTLEGDLDLGRRR